jgi:hypothetical protein
MKYLALALVFFIYFVLLGASQSWGAGKYDNKWWLAYHMAGYNNTMHLGPFDTKDLCERAILAPNLVFLRCQFR